MNKIYKKGTALLIAYMVIVVFVVFSLSLIGRSVSEANLSRRYVESVQAFWLAEAGINHGLGQLRIDFNATGPWNITLGSGSCLINVTTNGTQKYILATGLMPADNPRVVRVIEAIMNRNDPAGFYDHAIYSAGNVEITGSSYDIEGNVTYAGTFSGTTVNIHDPAGNPLPPNHDTSISPLARLDFEWLYNMANSQVNEHDSSKTNVYTENRVDDKDPFPTSFWYSRGDDGVDNDGDSVVDEADEWVPNIVYVETDLVLNGNIGTVGGFFVVVGDVLTDPDETEDATINGNGQIEGAIYTRGEFRINGGGSGLNVNGGIWSGTQTTLKGGVTVEYNSTYMQALDGMDIGVQVQVVSWQDKQGPYKITP